MHEVSICQSIINTVQDEFSEEQLENIREVHLKVGLLSCVEPEFLKQVYEFMIVDTKLKNSTLEFERVEVVAACENCGENFKVAQHVFICPVCKIPSSNIVEGKELLINKIIFEEHSYEEAN